MDSTLDTNNYNNIVNMENGRSCLRTTMIFPYLVTTIIILFKFNACFGAQSFWKVWSKQYLNVLQCGPKWRNSSDNIKVSPLKLYVIGTNPNSRAVLMLVDILGVNVNIIDALDDFSLLHDPSETTEDVRPPPILMDGKLTLDAHDGILQYVVDKYGTPQLETLYPRNETERALVDEMLLFHEEHISTAYDKFLEPLRLHLDKTVTMERIKGILQSYEYLERSLTDHSFLTGKYITIADLAVYATVSNMAVVAAPKVNMYPKLNEWIYIMSQQGFSKKHNKPAADLSYFIMHNVLKYTNDTAEYKPSFDTTDVDYKYILDNIKKLSKECSKKNSILA